MPAHARHRRWRRRPARPGSGPGGLVLFELGLTGMGYAEQTRSTIRIRTAPRTRSAIRIRTAPLQLDSQQLRWLGRTISTVQTEPLQLFVGFGPVGPPGAL